MTHRQDGILRIPRHALTVLYVLLAIAYFFARANGPKPLYLAMKALPLALLVLNSPWKGRYRRLVAAGLACSIIGDVLLETPLKLIGIAAFLGANALYIVAFTGKSRKPALLPCAASYSYGIAGFCLLNPFKAKLAIPAIVYMFVITTMLWRAWAQSGHGRRERTAFAGALLFVASDTILGYKWFAGDFPFASLILMIAYWAGQYCIFLSAAGSGEERREVIPEGAAIVPADGGSGSSDARIGA